MPIVCALAIFFAGCAHDPLADFPQAKPFQNFWVWNLDLASIDIVLAPYPPLNQVSSEEGWNSLHNQNRILYALQAHFQQRFNAWGYQGQLSLRLPSLTLTKSHVDGKKTLYKIDGMVLVRLDHPEQYYEDVWPLHVEFHSPVELEDEDQERLFQSMLNHFVLQVQNYCGSSLAPYVTHLQLL